VNVVIFSKSYVTTQATDQFTFIKLQTGFKGFQNL